MGEVHGVTVTAEHIHLRGGKTWPEGRRYYFVFCSWRLNRQTDNFDRARYDALTTTEVSKVTCPACLESAIKFGDAARDRFLELERAAGDTESEVST